MLLYYSKDHRSRLPLGACSLSKALFSHLSSLARAVPGRARAPALQLGDWFKLVTRDTECYMRAFTPSHPSTDSLYDPAIKEQENIILCPASLYVHRKEATAATVLAVSLPDAMIPCTIEPLATPSLLVCQEVELRPLSLGSHMQEDAHRIQIQVVAGLLIDCIVTQDMIIDTWLSEFHLHFQVVRIVPGPTNNLMPISERTLFKISRDTQVRFAAGYVFEPGPALLPKRPQSLSMELAMQQLASLYACHKHTILGGPLDTGKSELVRQLCARQGLPLYILNPAKLHAVGDMDSEQRLRQAFAEACSLHPKAVLLIQNMDLLATGFNEAHAEPALHSLKQLTCTLIELVESESFAGRWTVGTTERLEELDPRIRKSNRWSGTVMLPALSEADRRTMLEAFFPGEIQGNMLAQVAACTHGFSYSQMLSLGHVMKRRERKAESEWLQSVNDIYKGRKVLSLDLAFPKGEGTQWDSVGGYDAIKMEISQAVEWPLKYRATMSRLGLRPCSGILLHGPPGCSKTSLARLSAACSNVHFIGIAASELYSCYIGESERYLREIFKEAKSKAPCILFLDELDALVGSRALRNDSGGASSGGSGPSSKDVVQERILSMLLNELDGIEERPGVMIMAATNRVDRIDSALLRPGRFDKVIYVGLPDQATRHQILQLYTRKMPLAFEARKASVLFSLSERMGGYSGADCENLCQEAAMIALRNDPSAMYIEEQHFEAALRLSKSNSSEEHRS